MSTESNNSSQRQSGDYREDHEPDAGALSPVSVGRECDSVTCDRIMSPRWAANHNRCAFCQPTEAGE